MQLDLKRLFTSFYIIVIVLITTGNFEIRSARAAGLWYVKNGGSDGNDCQSPATACASINAALNKPGVVAGDTIRVAVGTYTGTGSEVVLLNKSVTLSGGWDATFTAQSGMATIDGQSARRGITINGNVTVDRFIVHSGNSLFGGGVSNAGTLLLTNSTIRNNIGGEPGVCGGGGAGILSQGNLRIDNSTIYSNTVLPCASGSAINMWLRGVLELNNSTVSTNKGDSAILIYYNSDPISINNSTITNNEYHGLLSAGGHVNMQNTIISKNGMTSGYDCVNDSLRGGTVVSSGYNLIGTNSGCALSSSDVVGIDPFLGVLQDNGGPTPSHALLFGSQAINAGNPDGCMGNTGMLATDQRGLPRVSRCDIGAFEEQSPFAVSKTVTKSLTWPGDFLAYQIVVSKHGSTGITPRITDSLPSDIDYVPNSLTATGGSYDYDNRIITWNGEIKPGEIFTISFGATVKPSAASGNTIINSAKVESSGLVLTRSVTSTITSQFSSLHKTADRRALNPGDTVNYTIAFTTSHVYSATSVSVTDTLPAYLFYTQGSLNTNRGNVSYNNGTIAWTGNVDGGTPVTISYKANISPLTPRGTRIANTAIFTSRGEVLARTAYVDVPHFVHFPNINHVLTCSGICGYVTQNGVPVSNVPVLLRSGMGSYWFTYAWTMTGTDGSYAFTDAHTLYNGDKYYVLFENSTTNTRLSSWSTRILDSYTAGTNVVIGNFDIANIVLVSPTSGAKVAPPITFSWELRTKSPLDSYQFNLFDPNNPSTAAWTSPLGYINNVTINGLPIGFRAGTPYGWYIATHSPDGGYGTSYYYRLVTFSSTGGAGILHIPFQTQPQRKDWQGKPPAHLQSR